MGPRYQRRRCNVPSVAPDFPFQVEDIPYLFRGRRSGRRGEGYALHARLNLAGIGLDEVLETQPPVDPQTQILNGRVEGRSKKGVNPIPSVSGRKNS